MDKNKILLCVLGIILFIVGFIIGAGASNKKVECVCEYEQCIQTGHIPVDWANNNVEYANKLARYLNDYHNMSLEYLEKFPTID